MIVVMSGLVSQLISRTGARPFMLAGTVIVAGGLFWFSRLTEHSTYPGGLLGPMLITSAGLGMLFVPLSLVALTQVRGEDSGIASSLLNTGQQVGGAIGLAALGTVTWTVVANSSKHQAAASAGHAGQALAAGISRGFLVAAGIAAVAFLLVSVTIRGRRSIDKEYPEATI